MEGAASSWAEFSSHDLPLVGVRITCVGESFLWLQRLEANKGDSRLPQKVVRIRVLGSYPGTAHAERGDMTAVFQQGAHSVVVTGDPAFTPNSVALMEFRCVFSGDEDEVPYADDGVAPVYAKLHAPERRVVQFAPSVEWHRLCVLGEKSATVNWVQPPYHDVSLDTMTNAESNRRRRITTADVALVEVCSKSRTPFTPLRNYRDCDSVLVTVYQHRVEQVSGSVGVRVMLRGVECRQFTAPRHASELVVSPLDPLAVYSVFVQGVYHQRADSDRDGSHQQTSLGACSYGQRSLGRWFITLAPEDISVEAISDETIRLTKKRQVVPEIAAEEFERRCTTALRWRPYSFDIPPAHPQRLIVRASWVDNEHIRAQRQDEVDQINELLDITRAFHVIERWRKMVRRVRKERRQFKRRLSHEKTSLDASFASNAGDTTGPLSDHDTSALALQSSSGVFGATQGASSSFDDAAFAKRKSEVSFLVSFQKSRRATLQRLLAGDFLVERDLPLPERWDSFSVSELPAQAMFRVVVEECSTEAALSGGHRNSTSASGTAELSRLFKSLKGWAPVATLPVLTWSDEGDVDRGGVQQHSAQYLRELLELPLSQHVVVEQQSERSITISWSPVDFERVAQVVYELQAQQHTQPGGSSALALTSAAPAAAPTPTTPSTLHLGSAASSSDATSSPEALRAELQKYRDRITRVQQLEDKRIQFEYAIITVALPDTPDVPHDLAVLNSQLFLGELIVPAAAAAGGVSPASSSLTHRSDADAPKPDEDAALSTPAGGGGVGSLIHVFLSGSACAPANTPSPFDRKALDAVGAKEERLKSYQHHHTITGLAADKKYAIQLVRYNPLEGRWTAPCPPLLTCTASHPVVSVVDFPPTGELNASVTVAVPDGWLSQMEAGVKGRPVFAHNTLPRHMYSFSGNSSLELKLHKMARGEGAPAQVVTTRSCSLREAAKGLVFRNLEPNSVYKVTCRRITAQVGRFTPTGQLAGAAQHDSSSPSHRRTSRSGSKMGAELLAARSDASMTSTVFTVRALPVFFTDVTATDVTVLVKKRHRSTLSPGGSAHEDSPRTSFCSSTSAIQPSVTLLPVDTPSDDEDDIDDDPALLDVVDPGAAHAILSRAHGVCLLSNTADTAVTNFDPLAIPDHKLIVPTEGFDRIVAIALLCRSFGSNEDMAHEEFEIMWPKVTVSLSLVVDWSLLPFSISDVYTEFLLSPVHCLPDLDLTQWADEESEEKMALFQEVGRHLKRLMEMREENNVQFSGLKAEIEIALVGESAGQHLHASHGKEAMNSSSSSQHLVANASGLSSGSSAAHEGSKGAPRSVTIACTGSPVCIPNLKPNTQYRVRIRPVLGGGSAGRVTYGAWSPHVQLRTASPLTMHIDHVDDQSVSLHWQRPSPHPNELHTTSQLQMNQCPQPLKHPQFVANSVEFLCFLYRHVIYGPVAVHWRGEGGDASDKSEETTPGSSHYVLKELTPGTLIFLCLQQRLAPLLIGEGGGVPSAFVSISGPEGSGDVSAEVSTSATPVPPSNSVFDDNSDVVEDTRTGTQQQGGSWSTQVIAVRTVGEFRAHVTPLGDNKFSIIVARPGFRDQQHHGTHDASGRPVVVHVAKETPVSFVQLRLLADYRGPHFNAALSTDGGVGGRGLLDANDDADLMPTVHSTLVDGAEYWNAHKAGEHMWVDRSGVTDTQVPFHRDVIDVTNVCDIVPPPSALGRGSSLKYRVVNCYTNPDMTYVVSGLARGVCYQVQVRCRTYPSVDRVPGSGLDPRSSANTIVTPWSVPSLLVTYHRASLALASTTETTVTLAWRAPPAPVYVPQAAMSQPLSRVEIEVAGFASRAAPSDMDPNPAPPPVGSNPQQLTLYDASDVPHRFRSHVVTRAATERTDDAAAGSSGTVAVEQLLPGGVGVAVIVPYYGDLRGPTSALCVFNTVCPVSVAICGVSTLYAAVSVCRRAPQWQECLGGIEHVLRAHPSRVRHVALREYASEETQGLIAAAQQRSTRRGKRVSVSASAGGLGAQGEQDTEGSSTAETFEVEVRRLDKDVLPQAVPDLCVLDAPTKNDFLLCNLAPDSIFQVRGRPAMEASLSVGTMRAAETWSRPTIFATLPLLQLRLLASFASRCVFAVLRGTPADVGLVRRMLKQASDGAPLSLEDEYVELALAEPHGARAVVDSSRVSLCLQREAAIRLTGLTSGCAFPVVCRLLPSIHSKRLPATYVEGLRQPLPSCFSWQPLGSVVSSPYAPSMPVLYEARGSRFVSLFWEHTAESSERLGNTLRVIASSAVTVEGEEKAFSTYTAESLQFLAASIQSGEVTGSLQQAAAELCSAMKARRVGSITVVHRESGVAGGTESAILGGLSAVPTQHSRRDRSLLTGQLIEMACPSEYPPTPYEAAKISFQLQLLVGGVDGREALQPHTLGEVDEPFARLQFAYAAEGATERLRLRLKAIVSLAHDGADGGLLRVESDWSPSYTFTPPTQRLHAPQHLTLVASYGNRSIISWDAPAHGAAGHNQVRFQVQVMRSSVSSAWRDAVWMRGTSTRCVLHGLVAKEPHKVRVIAHSTFAPLDGVSSAVLLFTPFARDGHLTADDGGEETRELLADIIDPSMLAHCPFPCRLRDDSLFYDEPLPPLPQRPSLFHAESSRSRHQAGRPDALRINEAVIACLTDRDAPPRPRQLDVNAATRPQPPATRNAPEAGLALTRAARPPSAPPLAIPRRSAPYVNKMAAPVETLSSWDPPSTSLAFCPGSKGYQDQANAEMPQQVRKHPASAKSDRRMQPEKPPQAQQSLREWRKPFVPV